MNQWIHGLIFAVGAIIGATAVRITERQVPAPGEYMLHQWEGTQLNPNHDGSIFVFGPYDGEKFEAGDYSVEIDELGRWYVVPSA